MIKQLERTNYADNLRQIDTTAAQILSSGGRSIASQRAAVFAIRSAAREIGHGENSFVAQILQNHRIPHAQKIADVNRPADAHRRLVNDLGLPRNKRRLQDAQHAFQLESATRIANVINSLTPDALSEERTRLLSQSLGKVGIAYEQTK